MLIMINSNDRSNHFDNFTITIIIYIDSVETCLAECGKVI